MPTERIAVRDIYIYFLCKPFYTLLFSNAKKNDVSIGDHLRCRLF